MNTTAWFLLAMAMHPEVQAKAQRELDSAFNSRRLPEHDDLGRLPYCHAVFLEILRWRATVPLGIPHRVMAEDEYGGYRIPKGAIIIPVRPVLDRGLHKLMLYYLRMHGMAHFVDLLRISSLTLN